MISPDRHRRPKDIMTPEEAKIFIGFHEDRWIREPALFVWEPTSDDPTAVQILWDEVETLELDSRQSLATDPVLSLDVGEDDDGSPLVLLFSTQSALDMSIYPIRSAEEIDSLVSRLLELKTSTFDN